MVERPGARLIVELQNAESPVQRRALFDELVRQYATQAYGYACSLLGDPHAAEDATQEAFLIAYQRLDQLRDPQAFPGWLRRIVHSQCHRWLRRQKEPDHALDLSEELPAAEPSPHLTVERRELREQILAAIAALPTSEGAPLHLYYLDDRSQQEIAAALDLSVAAVKKRLQRARHRLAERMRDMAQDYQQTRRETEGNPADSLAALLSAAALEGQFVLLETLLVEGMDVNEADANGETLLHWAAQTGHLEAVDLLLAYDPDLSRRDRSGRTALDLAMANGHRAVAARLRQVARERTGGA